MCKLSPCQTGGPRVEIQVTNRWSVTVCEGAGTISEIIALCYMAVYLLLWK